MWPGSDTRPRDWSRVLVKITNLKGLHRLLTEQQLAYCTNNRISTSGTCKFARDGPEPSYAIRFAFGMLPLLIYETILCFPILWKAIQNYGIRYGSSFLSGMVHDSIFSVLCLDLTPTLLLPPWGMFIISLPAHPREVKITNITPALDEFYIPPCNRGADRAVDLPH
ncbi:hypothetical protein BU17DRAFT_60081 [Hysterangium stoloniferum]|nr:hypothetical protein BU17DRAFT_60081 [Hysterangium stoloniferum]